MTDARDDARPDRSDTASSSASSSFDPAEADSAGGAPSRGEPSADDRIGCAVAFLVFVFPPLLLVAGITLPFVASFLGLHGLMIFAMGALVVGGLPYAVVALVIAVVTRLRPVHLDSSPEDDRAAAGLRFGQLASLTLAILLLPGLFWLGCVIALGADDNAVEGLLLYCGGPVLLAGLLSIAANAPSLYSPDVISSEVWAVRTRAPSRAKILTMWVLAPLSWFGYAVPAFLYVLANGLEFPQWP